MANFLLVFDVGGTYIRATHVVHGEKKELIKIAHGPFRSFLDWLKSSTIKNFKADHVVIAAAGPKEEEGIRMTNLDWFLDQKELENYFMCPVVLLNDLQAAVHILPTIDQIIPLQGTPQKGTRALIAPGTGLGEAFIVPNGKKWLAIGTESGQTLYTPKLDFGKKTLRIEDLLSGSGLSLIHATLTGQKLSPEEVGALGGKAVIYFLELLLQEAQNFAFRTLPWGGIFFGGAIIRALSPVLQKIGVATFSRHPNMGEMLKKIPLAIIPSKDIVLQGAIIAATESEP